MASTRVFTLQREAQLPTAVHHAVAARVFTRQRINLVTVQGNVLTVYKLRAAAAAEQATAAAANTPARLEECARFVLHAAPTSIAAASVLREPRDLILLTFEPAKLSVVQYNPYTHTLDTVSMHAYEDAETIGSYVDTTLPPLVKVDPSQRCAALRIYGRQMVIIALEQYSADETQNSTANASATPADDAATSTSSASAPAAPRHPSTSTGTTTVQRFRSTLLQLQQAERVFGSITDFTFLHGYSRPTLLLLHEPQPVYVGRYAIGKDSHVASVFSISPHPQGQGAHHELPPLVWTKDRLPSDAFKVVPLPLPLGGVLVCCTNCLLQLDQANLSGLALNRNCDESTGLQLQRQPALRVAFDSGAAVTLSDTQVLLAVRTGELYLLRMRAEGRLVEHFSVEHLHSTVQGNCLTLIGSNFVFLGSRLANSLLLHIEFELAATAAGGNGKTGNNSSSTVNNRSEPPNKRPALVAPGEFGEAKEGTDTMQTDLEDDLDIYDVVDGGSNRLAVGAGAGTSRALETYKLRIFVCDFLTNIAPVISTTVAFPEDEQASVRTGMRHQYNLVACTGHGKNSAISTIRTSVRPQIVLTTDSLQDCRDVWAVYGSVSADDLETSSQPLYHSYLVLSKANSTLVLSTASSDLVELTDSGFYTDVRTIYAGNMGLQRLIVQVTTRNLVLLKDGVRLHEQRTPRKRRYRLCAVAEPFVMMLLDDGSLALYKLDEQNEKFDIVEATFGLANNHTISSISLFRDTLGLLRVEQEEHGTASASDSAAGPSGATIDSAATVPTTSHAPTAPAPALAPTAARPMAAAESRVVGMDEDEDDAFLYGDTMAAPPPTGATTAATGAVDAQAATAVGSATTAMADGAARTTVSVDEAIYSAPLDATELPAGVAAATEVQPQVWCVLCTAQGQMRILRLPDLTEVFCSTAFGQGHTLVWDSPSRSEADTLHCTVTEAGAATGSSTMAPATDGKDQDDGASASASAASVGGVAGEIEEAVLMAVGRPATRLYLVARSRRAHIMVYEVFPSAATDSEPPSKPNPAAPVQPSTASTGRLAARLRKITHRLTRLHERDIAGQTRRFRPFADIGQCSGLFICGPRPHFLVAGHSRKAVRMHPMLLDGAVRCFAAFNHSSCPNGFVYFTVDGGLMRTAVVPPGETLSDPTLAVRRTRLPHTACAISYGPQARVFALATHEKRPARRMVRMSNDPVPPNQPDVAWRPGEVPVMEDVFRLQLLSPLDWAVVPDTTVELPIDHHITSLKVVELTTQQIGDDKRQYLAVGVSMAFGEHVTSEGYVLLYDVLTVVPEPGKPTTKNKLKEVARYEHKGAITAVDCVRGHLVVAVGQPDGAKIYVHYFRDGEELQPLAFYEASVYTALLRVIDSLVLLGDYAQGLDLLRLNEQKLHQWQMIQRKTHKQRIVNLVRVSRDVEPSDVMTAEFLVKGDALRIVLLDRWGNVVVCGSDSTADNNSGGRVLFRESAFYLGRRVVASMRLQCAGGNSNWHFVKYLSLEGSQGHIVPIDEVAYRRLEMLQAKLHVVLPHLAGLNPKGERAYRERQWQPRKVVSTTLDGDLLDQYTMLSLPEQIELAQQIGTTPNQLYEDYMTAEDSAQYF